MLKLLFQSLLSVVMAALRTLALLVFGAVLLALLVPDIDPQGGSARVYYVGVSLTAFLWNRPLLWAATERLVRGLQDRT